MSNVKADRYSSAIENLISDVLINDTSMSSEVNASASSNTSHPQDLDDIYRTDTHTIRFSRINNLGVIFVCVYQSILQLSYAEELVSYVKTVFINLYRGHLLESIQTGEPFPRNLNFDKFNSIFNEKVKTFEKNEQVGRPLHEKPETSTESISEISENKSKNESFSSVSGLISLSKSEDESSGVSTPVASLPGKKKVRRGGKNKNKLQKATAAALAEGDDSKKRKVSKKMRKWTSDGVAEEIDSDSDENTLDFSNKSLLASRSGRDQVDMELDMDKYGKENNNGDFLVSTLSDDEDSEDYDTFLHPNEGSTSGGITSKLPLGFLKNFMGGKTLTPEDLTNTLEATRTHLMAKNVAPEVAENLCDTVKTSLLGSKTKNWTSVEATVQEAMADALRRVLTPNTSADLLFEIRKKAKANKDAAKGISAPGATTFSPYVMSVVGVNGVGKSTNLSKIAFWLLQNKFKVLIAACDTFRSGAVEQLRVHVNRLQELTARNNSGHIDMFEEGYGKDAAVIAQHAVEHGRRGKYDVVLIDTAGRRHNDEGLMSSLEKFGKLAAPDKIVMVGEALVGTDSVQQARNFNAAFGPNRNIDFFLISKCDTVGEMVGSLVNMTYSTNIPVLFVGTGQNYTDLRTLSVEWAVQLLMK